MLVLFGGSPSAALVVEIGALREIHSRETISIFDIPANDDTFANAQLGATDNNTTGKFNGQTFDLVDRLLSEEEDPKSAIQSLADRGVSLIVADLTA